MTTKYSQEKVGELDIFVRDSGYGKVVERAVVAVKNGTEVGRIEAHSRGKAWTVGLVQVSRDVRRQGVGTVLYEKLLRSACADGRPVRSDDLRSHFAEAFWQKQFQKGRAACVAGDGGMVYPGPLASLRRREPALAAEIEKTLPQPTASGEWPCKRYTIKNSCAVESLKGAKRRRQR